ncbi:potassium channel family protein [Streptomyces sp. NPDC051940]|uniref:potassium channel family protein n=1 Tax=Streptomyces sp. NPDC051940 TaxID=3155675 RepID=UPI00342D5A6A
MRPLTREQRWERAAYRPMLVLALLFAVAYAVPILAKGASPVLRHTCLGIEWAVWGAFAFDYVVRLGLTDNRRKFLRTHWLDLLIVLLPLIQPFRLLRLVSAVLLTGRRVRAVAQVRITTYVGGSLLGLLGVGSLAVLEAEKGHAGSNIHSYGDAAWWAFATMTTVGYGDHSPTTALGRWIAVALMISGIALIGLVTANIAAWFIARFEAENQREVVQEVLIRDLADQVAALNATVADLAARLGEGRPAAPAPEEHAEVPGARPVTLDPQSIRKTR